MERGKGEKAERDEKARGSWKEGGWMEEEEAGEGREAERRKKRVSIERKRNRGRSGRWNVKGKNTDKRGRDRESASGRERETSPVVRASGPRSSPVISQERMKQEIERLRRTSALMRQRRGSQGGVKVMSRYSGSTVGGASMVTMGSPVHLVVRSIRNKILLSEDYMEAVIEEVYDRD